MDPFGSGLHLVRSTMPGWYKACQIGRSEQQVHLQHLLHLEFRVQFWRSAVAFVYFILSYVSVNLKPTFFSIFLVLQSFMGGMCIVSSLMFSIEITFLTLDLLQTNHFTLCHPGL